MRELLINGWPLVNPYVGIGVYTRRLLEALLAHAPEVRWRVLLPAESAACATLPAAVQVPLSCRWMPRHPLTRQVVWSHWVCQRARQLNPEALFYSPGPIWSAARPRHAVVTLHDCIYRRFPVYLGNRGLRKWYTLATERFAARADLVMTDSACSAADLVQFAHLDPAKLAVVHPWVDDPPPASPSPPPNDLPARFWMYVGGYDVRKNVEFLLEAYAAVAREIPLPPLVLVGNIPTGRNPCFGDIQGTLARTGLLPSQVILPGRLSDENLQALYLRTSLCLFPSLFEGFGYTPAEAIGYGAPILTSPAGSVQEIVANPHCYFDPTNRSALCEKLRAAAIDEAPFRTTAKFDLGAKAGIARFLAALPQNE